MIAGRFRQRIFPVCPTKTMAGLLFVLFAMWYAAASQNNTAAYLLLFALAAVFLVSVPHTMLNLRGLRVTTESMKPTFAGQEVSLPVEIMNHSGAARHGILFSLPDSSGVAERIDNIPAGKAARTTIRFPALKRGEHQLENLCLSSVYPLGFLRSMQRVPVLRRYIVYPKPAGDPALPIDRAHSAHAKPKPEFGEGDDFAGVRPYVLGESQRHIDWKAVARGQALMTKQFSAEASGSLYLDLADVSAAGMEDRLSQLTLWVIEAERARHPYGLRLPSGEIAPSLGKLHFHRCLRSLALFHEGTA
jgi:uncharacterized protein (DUF58 family)